MLKWNTGRKILLTAMVVLVVMTGCGRKNAAADLYAQGFMPSGSFADENGYHAFFTNEEKPGSVYRVDAVLTEALYEKYAAIDFDDEKGIRNFLSGLSEVKTEDISALIPDDNALGAYKGMTVEAFEACGYENSGYVILDADDVLLFYDGAQYALDVYISGISGLDGAEEITDAMWDVLETAEIDHIEFQGLSMSLLEN